MVLASMLIGIGYAFNNPASSHILKRVTPPRLRNLVYSIKQAGVPVGGILAALVMPPLSARPAGGRLLAFAVATLALGAASYPGGNPGTATGIRRPRLPAASSRGNRRSGRRRACGRLPLIACSTPPSSFASRPSRRHAGRGVRLVPRHGRDHGRCDPGLRRPRRIVCGLVADLIGAGFAVLAFLGAVTAACCFLLYFAGGILPPLPRWPCSASSAAARSAGTACCSPRPRG